VARGSQAGNAGRELHRGRDVRWCEAEELMGVRIRKREGKWYVFVNYRGRRKAKCVGTSRQLAEQVRHQLEAKLVLGDLGFLMDASGLTFDEYSQRWVKQHAEVELKPSTVDSYRQLLRLYVNPKFGSLQVTAIQRGRRSKTFWESCRQKGSYHVIPCA
jgi:hypothetical protein